MTMPGDISPLPIVCVMSEHRQGSQLRVEAEIRSNRPQSGRYRLLVMKQGPSGSAQVSQQSEFSLVPGSPVRVEGLSFSLEPYGRYRARLSVRAGDAEYACEREGPDGSDSL
ncbi:curli-like amyloid fiber formation chaperone CsgH [Methylobacterium sp. AMS5]|uniref:curli-like amyloid fiber formation chaperone CsgH n=1 Tax=Methylobacterium sp. AMS5 TaxID=925818 RepID=UPI00074F94F1|nr:curli-like amyloid fiber formation chaperone CsgH [Methylobacterium sp. AMS5]AMB43281.1 hypothetical protein Y590_00100 [Methylobacterium sp. AMS5]